MDVINPARKTRARKPARPVSLTEKVHAMLRAEILTCALRPGQELNEAELADRFRISKTPVREALSNLRQEGLVQTFPRRGYRITPITFGDMNELFDVRTILEAGAAEIACARVGVAEIESLNRLADVIYDRGEQPSLAPFIRANREFHLAIARATGNARLEDLLARQIDALERFFYLGAQLRDVSVETSISHHAIVEVLAGRDPARAREIMIQHNDQTREGLTQALTSSRGAVSISL
ncbi:MAG: GntR family transcriptional regulator [Rhodovulum sulfidophilum]|uniref:GntR family transcriptional regulator n=1 Tax=Rhodovulum sulfidophilum TaxID=35806 RepID=A0A2W5N4N6_RHOSU|nr:MAG: GntR family transcriptional regulator [Rhodovulum sulfidophilum]